MLEVKFSAALSEAQPSQPDPPTQWGGQESWPAWAAGAAALD